MGNKTPSALAIEKNYLLTSPSIDLPEKKEAKNK